MKGLRLVFLDKTETLLPLDTGGYLLESELVKYIKQDTQPQYPVKYAFHSSPTSRITLPSPFDGDGI